MSEELELRLFGNRLFLVIDGRVIDENPDCCPLCNHPLPEDPDAKGGLRKLWPRLRKKNVRRRSRSSGVKNGGE